MQRDKALMRGVIPACRWCIQAMILILYCALKGRISKTRHVVRTQRFFPLATPQHPTQMHPLLVLVHRYPWLANVAAYGTLFSAADAAQQMLTRPRQDPSRQDSLDLKQTGKVALVGFTFHANFNYVWFRSLERLLPGVSAPMVIAKVTCDQVIAAPVTIGAFYTGEKQWRMVRGRLEEVGNTSEMATSFPHRPLPLPGLSLLDGETDISGKLREKFWPTYKVVNFTLVPPILRTAYVGACSFLWTAFLCYLRQRDAHDITSQLSRALPVLAMLFPPTAGGNQINGPSEK
ncbi:mpv17-like protein isoform X2 [Hemicordylus capensis]|uniref:mpv17-like protein isoform X2 n=1 Tax=Hemicordylus capensis TaxID=884348 RepID=UPI0023021E61|nr:mpv17-like protein isoform X2 [Hemicordylus capensis]